MKITKKTKLLLTLLVVIIVGFLIYLQFFYQASVLIKVKPKTAGVLIGDQTGKVGVNKIKPGISKVVVSSPGYFTYQKNLVVNFFSNQPLVIDLKKVPAFTKLDRGRMSYLKYDEATNSLFYLKNQAAYRLILEGDNPQPERVSPPIFKGVESFDWAENFQGALVQIKNARKLKGTKLYRSTKKKTTWFYDFNRYDLQNQRAIYWGTGYGDCGLAPNQRTVSCYYSTLTKESSLISTNTRHKKFRRVQKLSKFKDPDINWQPNKQYILVVQNRRIGIYDTYFDQLSKVIADQRIKYAQVSPDSKKIIYTSTGSGTDYPMAVMTIEGKEKTNLNLNARFINLDWYNNSKFCGIGQKEGQPILFCYDTKKDIEIAFSEMVWKKVESNKVAGFQVDSKNDLVYLIKNNRLVSVPLIPANY